VVCGLSRPEACALTGKTRLGIPRSENTQGCFSRFHRVEWARHSRSAEDGIGPFALGHEFGEAAGGTAPTVASDEARRAGSPCGSASARPTSGG